MNHIHKLTAEVRKLQYVRTQYAGHINAFRIFLNSPKFQGVDLDGSRKDWISTTDVLQWLRDIDNHANASASEYEDIYGRVE